MEFDDLQPLRRAGAGEGERPAEPGAEPEYPEGAGISPNPVTELVADLIETTNLIPVDRLASARSRAGTGSLSAAIMDERLTAA